MPDPDVVAALARAGLPTNGQVQLFHATSRQAADSISAAGRLTGDASGQAWLASNEAIAALHHAAGASTTPSASPTNVQAIVVVEVSTDDIYFETTRPADAGDVELFYLLDGGSGCPVRVLDVRRWP
jgi:hypothetical protein